MKTPKMSSDKKVSPRILVRMLDYIQGKTWLLVLAFVFAILSVLLQVVGPEQVKQITNEIMLFLPQNQTEGFSAQAHLVLIQNHIFMVLGLYVFSFVLRYVQSYIVSYLVQKASYELRKSIFEKLHRLPFAYFDTTTTGDILSRVTNDVETVNINLNQTINALLSSAIFFVGILVMMFWTHMGLASLTFFIALLGMGIIGFVMANSQKLFSQQQKGLGELNGHIEESYSGHLLVQAYSASKKMRETFDESNQKLQEFSWKSQFFANATMPIMLFFENLSYVIVCVVGSSLALSGHMSFGIVVAFMMYVRFFNQPLSSLAQSVGGLQSASAALARVLEFVDEKELEDETDKQGKVDLSQIKGDVCFEHVKFGYKEDKIIIKDFSASVKAGQKVAIVGPTGAGKTTLVNLLMRFYELNDGKIYLDGQDTRSLARQEVQKCFGMVLQEAWIFEGTIYENIVYNKTDVPKSKVVEVCKTIGLHHFIKTLPKAYDTIINEKSSLSEGQKQLLTIARVMVQNAPLLILDEATSSVDTRTETLVQAAMDKVAEGKTSFVIAHRLSTIKNADLILVLNEGDILEQGTHQELLDQQGFYADLYHSQFSTSTEE